MPFLNPESVSYLAKDTTYKVAKEGKLFQKQTASNSKQIWEVRHAILKGNLLFLFKKKLDKTPCYLFLLEDCVTELISDEISGKEFSFQIRFLSSDSCYTFAADTGEALEEWVSAIATCSFEQLQLKLESMKETIVKKHEKAVL